MAHASVLFGAQRVSLHNCVSSDTSYCACTKYGDQGVALNANGMQNRNKTPPYANRGGCCM